MGIFVYFIKKLRLLFDIKLLFIKIRSPPRSPDLNPIEMVWHEMKRFIRKSRCKTESEVVAKIF